MQGINDQEIFLPVIVFEQSKRKAKGKEWEKRFLMVLAKKHDVRKYIPVSFYSSPPLLTTHYCSLILWWRPVHYARKKCKLKH